MLNKILKVIKVITVIPLLIDSITSLKSKSIEKIREDARKEYLQLLLEFQQEDRKKRLK